MSDREESATSKHNRGPEDSEYTVLIPKPTDISWPVNNPLIESIDLMLV